MGPSAGFFTTSVKDGVNILCNIPISSSIIRKNIKLNQNFEGLDLKVKKYIEKKNLYCRY